MTKPQSPFQLSVKTITIEYDATITAGDKLNSPIVAAAYIVGWNRANNHPPDQECFSVFGLDNVHRLISAETLTKGTLDQAPVDPRRLFRHLIAVGAVGFIISHNHPSGDTVPSRADEELTKRLYKAGQLVGIALQDHIVTEPGGTWRALRATNPELWERIL